MSTEISLDIIKSTQDSLGKFVKKPPLTDKLLKKPPFRFLHDVIMAVMRTTRFFEGLFTEEELISDNVKDREKKIAFLQKVIKVVDIVTNSSLPVRPSKIISGQEPQNTNELLQKIGEALLQNLSSDKAVKTLTLEKQSPNEDKTIVLKNQKVHKKSSEKEAKKTDEKLTKITNTHEVHLRNKMSINSKKFEENKKLSSEKKNTDLKSKNMKLAEKSKNKETSDTKINKKEKQNKKLEPEIVKPSAVAQVMRNDLELDYRNYSECSKNETKNENQQWNAELHKTNNILIENCQPINDDMEKTDSNVNSHENVIDHQHIDSKKNKNDGFYSSVEAKENIQNQIEYETIIKTERVENKVLDSEINYEQKMPSSKQNKDKNIIANDKNSSINFQNDEKILNNVENRQSMTSLRPPSVRPSSSRPGAPRFKDTNVNIITNSSDNIPTAKVNIIIEHYDNQQEDDDGSVIVEQTLDDSIIDGEFFKSQIVTSSSNTHGHLVQRILETKKELDGDSTKVEIEWEWGARREREASYKEIECLKNGLQSLSKAANPLGKLIDYVQEDVEIMHQELLQWRDARRISANMLIQQESLTEKLIQPLEMKLKQLHENITDQLELVHIVKSNIQQNTKKIRKLIEKDEFLY